MSGAHFWWSYWYFHFPNYAFALLFWTLIGRFMFGLFLPPDSPNYIYRWFRRLSDWLMRPVAYVTHSIMPRFILPLVAAFWVAMARVAFFMAMYAAGLTPRVPVPG
jgi:YggT family protein